MLWYVKRKIFYCYFRELYKSMRILNWYVTKSFLITFFMAILVLTFAMTGANLVKVLDFISQGIPFYVFAKYMLYILPRVLTFTVPWAVMVAIVLVFGRLSADSEITAMRACGVSIMQIVSPILLITFMLTALCVYLQVEIGPPLLGKSREMLSLEAANRPLALFEPGSPFSIDDGSSRVVICIDNKSGENKLYGVVFYKTAPDGRVIQEINAEYGNVSANEEEQILSIDLYNCVFGDFTSGDKSSVKRAYTEYLNFKFNYGKQANAKNISIRAKYMPLRELLAEISRFKMAKQDTTKLEVELNKRIAFALSPIAFLLLGMPLAIRTNRRETSIGLFISVILAGTFFFSIIAFETMEDFPHLYPQYLLWIPNIIFQLLGAIMTYKISQR